MHYISLLTLLTSSMPVWLVRQRSMLPVSTDDVCGYEVSSSSLPDTDATAADSASKLLSWQLFLSSHSIATRHISMPNSAHMNCHNHRRKSFFYILLLGSHFYIFKPLYFACIFIFKKCCTNGMHISKI